MTVSKGEGEAIVHPDFICARAIYAMWPASQGCEHGNAPDSSSRRRLKVKDKVKTPLVL